MAQSYNYTSGFTDATVTAAVTAGDHAVDPFLNTGGTQDYTTLYQGGNGKTITPDSGLSNVAAPSAVAPGSE